MGKIDMCTRGRCGQETSGQDAQGWKEGLVRWTGEQEGEVDKRDRCVRGTDKRNRWVSTKTDRWTRGMDKWARGMDRQEG